MLNAITQARARAALEAGLGRFIRCLKLFSRGIMVTPVESAGWSLPYLLRWRKVRAPKGRVPGNAWGARAYGKCSRKYTA